jgi:predicted branched-subunit amino acid permease
MLLGSQVPASWQLDFTIPLAFIALVVPQIRTKQLLGVAIAAAVVAALTAALPFKLGVIASVLAGIALGLLWEARAQ